MTRPIKLGKGFKLDKAGRVTAREPADIAPDAASKIAARKRKTTRRRIARPGQIPR